MDCYIEVSWILMVAISFCAYSFAITLTSKQYAFGKALIILSLSYALSLLKYQSIFWIALITFLSDLWLSEFHFQVLFEIVLTRFFLLLMLSFVLHGKIINMILFIPTKQSCLCTLIGLSLFFMISVLFFQPLVAYEKHEYQVSIVLQNRKLQVVGFMDSGNFLVYNNIPVIFLNEKYHSFFQATSGIKIDYHTVSGQAECEVYLGSICIANKQKEVYVAFYALDGLDCLLNSQLLKHVEMVKKA